MPRHKETDCLRLQVMDPIEAVDTNIETGTSTTYLGTVFSVSRTSGTIRRGEGRIIIDPEERKYTRVRGVRKPKRGYPSNPATYTVELPMPPVRTYMDLYSRLIFYVPTAEQIYADGKRKIVIRRSSWEAIHQKRNPQRRG